MFARMASTARWRHAYRDHAFLAGDRDHGVVAVRAARGGVDEEMDVVVGGRHRRGLRKHDFEMLSREHLLQRVEGQAGELTLDEVRAVLHDGLELDVAVGALPARDEVQHVDALGGLAAGLAGGAGELDAEEGEDGLVRDGIAHLHEAGVEVDLAEQGADGEEGGVAHAEEGRDRLLRPGPPGGESDAWDAEFELLTREEGAPT